MSVVDQVVALFARPEADEWYDEAVTEREHALQAAHLGEQQHASASLIAAALLHLLLPKWLTARARTVQGEEGRGARFAILGFVGVLFWAFVFGVLYRLLTYFRGVEEIGALLA